MKPQSSFKKSPMKAPAERVVKDIRRQTQRHVSAEEAGAYKYSLRNEGNVWCIYVSTEPAQSASGALHSLGDSQLS